MTLLVRERVDNALRDSRVCFGVLNHLRKSRGCISLDRVLAFWSRECRSLMVPYEPVLSLVCVGS